VSLTGADSNHYLLALPLPLLLLPLLLLPALPLKHAITAFLQ
jgi:hypothetical protein